MMIYFLRNHYPPEFRDFLLMWRELRTDSPRRRHVIAAALTALSLLGILILT